MDIDTSWRAHLGLLGLGLVALAALVISCSGTAEVRATAQPTSLSESAPTATVMPDPTAAPVATSVPDATAVVDEPTATTVPDAGAAKPDEAEGASLPAFVDPPEELTSLVGTVSTGVVREFDYQATGQIGGGVIINNGDANEDWRGLTYVLDGDRIAMAISWLSDRTEDGKSIWELESVWMLQLPPESDISIGNDVCKAADVTHRLGQELFFVVTNKEQDAALGAWTITVDGPTEYEAFAELQCERFFP